MYKTFMVLIGIFVSVIALFMILNRAYMFTGQEETEVIEPASSIDGNELVISWTTERETNGKVVYDYAGIVKDEKYYEFSTTHKLRIDISGMSGEVKYTVESCDLDGECVYSEEESVNV
jgi:hypothetical protein